MAVQRQIKITRNGGGVTFDPPNLSANTGDQIFWTNDDTEAHWPGLLVQDGPKGGPKSGPNAGTINETFFMPNQIAPKSASSIFAPGAPSTYTYVCSIAGHAGETGTITVT